nr:hypothetical protein [uncultured Massilia sp.]
MEFDQRLYESIAAVLVRNAPSDAVILKFRCSSDINTLEGADYELFFDYVNRGGDENWFNIELGESTRRLHFDALKLRDLMRNESGLTWMSMNFEVNLNNKKFKVEFEY